VHFAAAKGHILCLRYLLAEAGATGNEKDDIDATPVHDAAEQGQLASLKLLAHYGADLGAVDADELTPRKLAIDRGHHDCGQFLVMALARRTAEPNPQAQHSTPAIVGSGGGGGGGGMAGVAGSTAIGLAMQGGAAGGEEGAATHSLQQHQPHPVDGGEDGASAAPIPPPVLSPKEQKAAEKKRVAALKVLAKKAKKEAALEAKRQKKASKSRKGAPPPTPTPALHEGGGGGGSSGINGADLLTGTTNPTLSGGELSVFKAESVRKKDVGGLSRPTVDLDLWEAQLVQQATQPPT
jgi:hypothetical protein